MAPRLALLFAFILALAHLAACSSRTLPETWDQFLGSDHPVFPTEINRKFLRTGGLSVPDPENGVLRDLEAMLNHPEISTTIYSNFLKAYKKDQNRRFQSAFKENVMEIARQNILYHARNSSWSEGINFFADMSDKEFYDFVSTGPAKKPQAHWTESKLFSNKSKRTNATSVPDNFDWRDKGYVGAIKYQGGCGSCWAFASVAAIEIGIAISTNGANKPVLSEQQLVDCFGKSCEGQLPYRALRYVVKNGLALDSDYPYTSGDTEQAGTCQKKPIAVRIKGRQETESEEEMKQWVAEIGPVAIGVYYSEGMARQKAGVFDGACGEKDGEPDGHHAMAIVGYGVEDGMDYWIIRNSHGTDCCDNGYLKLRRNTDKCGLSSYLGATVPLI